eukprot:TRINITY_DN22_c0_g1_i1.p1 TRINITY_DN22_c0_g1~~TRINITY_DN22_c0_g1_i1.p1  ORF type:complete len:494 (+),score=133.95 TRINITY_DN22_c0_g1_i1:176-1657(+)
MSQKQGKQKKEKLIQENSNDFFVQFMLKKIKYPQKKLKDITDLEERQKKGEQLKPEQQQKIATKDEVQSKIAQIEEIITLYLEALKEAEQPPQRRADETSPQAGQQQATSGQDNRLEELQQEFQARQEEAVEETRQRVTEQVLQTSLKLAFFSQFFADNQKRQELLNNAPGSQKVDFDAISDFYHKVFHYCEGDSFDTNASKLEASYTELSRYVNKSSGPALRNQTYQQLHDAVEHVFNSQYFQNQKAQVNVQAKPELAQVTTQQQAIGSEIGKNKQKFAEVALEEEEEEEHGTHHQQQQQHHEQHQHQHQHQQQTGHHEQQREGDRQQHDQQHEGQHQEGDRERQNEEWRHDQQEEGESPEKRRAGGYRGGYQKKNYQGQGKNQNYQNRRPYNPEYKRRDNREQREYREKDEERQGEENKEVTELDADGFIKVVGSFKEKPQTQQDRRQGGGYRGNYRGGNRGGNYRGEGGDRREGGERREFGERREGGEKT